MNIFFSMNYLVSIWFYVMCLMFLIGLSLLVIGCLTDSKKYYKRKVTIIIISVIVLLYAFFLAR
ncbi:MAG: hypothetical protein LBR40_03385 [Bacilli bacterium]|nr:hypothetical protein [Bacilli bacterium]